MFVFILLIFFLAACNSHDNIPVKNKNVTAENYDRIDTGDKETGKGGTSYSDVVSLFGGKPDEQTKTYDPQKTEAEWYYDEKGIESVTVKFIDNKAIKKSQKGIK